MTQFKS